MAYRDVILADNPSNYWRLNEPSGLTAVDQVGGANGTISGGVTLNQPGALADGDPAMAFNGTSGQITIAASVALALSFSIEAWVNLIVAPSGGNHVIFSNEGPTGTVLIYTAPSTLVAYSYGAAPAVVALSPVPINDGRWHHVVVTQDGTTLRGYLDGVLQSTTAQPRVGAGASSPAWIGSHTVDFWPGSLDEVAIYPVALTAAQIAAHYAAGISGARPISWGLYANGFAA